MNQKGFSKQVTLIWNRAPNNNSSKFRHLANEIELTTSKFTINTATYTKKSYIKY